MHALTSTHLPSRPVAGMRPVPGLLINQPSSLPALTSLRAGAATNRPLPQFVDTGGHEKYAKTALAGLTATLPDYALITVCAATGAQG